MKIDSKRFAGKEYHLLKLYSDRGTAEAKAKSMRKEGYNARLGKRRLGKAITYELWFRKR